MHSAGSAGYLWLHSLCLQCIVPAVLVACGLHSLCLLAFWLHSLCLQWLLFVYNTFCFLDAFFYNAGSDSCLWLHFLCLQCTVPAVLFVSGYTPCVCLLSGYTPCVYNT